MSSKKRSVIGQYYVPGEWNVWCQRCGRKRKSSEVSKQWDGLLVCKDKCYEERHPQDFVRGIADRQSVPYAAPEARDLYHLDADITGLTTADLAAGPENLWDDTNVLRVQLVSGALSTASELDVLNGANLCAVQNSSGGWEILQFTVASLTAPSTYALTHLLRGRYGTELAMGAVTNAPFVFIGQSGVLTPTWLSANLDTGDQLLSPVHVSLYEDNGDVVFEWLRRSRIPRLEIDNWADPYFVAPLDSDDERYEVDVLNGSGAVLSTLHSIGSPSVVYTRANHLSDWGSLQSSLRVRVYQSDAIFGRSESYRDATLPVVYSTAHDRLYDDDGELLRSEDSEVLTG